LYTIVEPSQDESTLTTLASRILALFAVLLLCACGPEAGEPFPEEDRLLEDLMEEYVAARFGFYPVESTLAGLAGNDGVLGSFSRSDVSRRVAWLSDFHTKLIGMRFNALSQSAYLDALWLTSLTKAELFDLEQRRLWALSPAFYGENIRAGLVSLLLAPDLAIRTDDLGGRLDAIPVLMDQAGENLGEIPEAFRRDGIRSLLRCRDLLSEMPLLLETSVPAYRVAELSEKSRLAERSLQALVSRLSEAPKGASGAGAFLPMGEEGLGFYFLHHEMVDWPKERILEEARAARSLASNHLTEVALDHLPDRDLRVLLAESVPSDAPASEVADFETRARASLSAGEVFPEDAIPVRQVPPYFIAPAWIRLFRPASLDPVKGLSLLVGAGAPLDAPQLELSTLAEVAGRYRLFVRQSESASLLRRVFRARTTGEGFESWLLSRALDRGYAEGDHELRLRQLHRALIEDLRLEVVVGIHAFGMSLGEAEERFREIGYLAPETAAYEAERAAVDPGAGSAALGRLLLEELARDYLRSHPLASSEELEDAFLSEGIVPLRLVRFKLLGTKP
jgi:hypothetical protein